MGGAKKATHHLYKLIKCAVNKRGRPRRTVREFQSKNRGSRQVHVGVHELKSCRDPPGLTISYPHSQSKKFAVILRPAFCDVEDWEADHLAFVVPVWFSLTAAHAGSERQIKDHERIDLLRHSLKWETPLFSSQRESLFVFSPFFGVSFSWVPQASRRLRLKLDFPRILALS